MNNISRKLREKISKSYRGNPIIYKEEIVYEFKRHATGLIYLFYIEEPKKIKPWEELKGKTEGGHNIVILGRLRSLEQSEVSGIPILIPTIEEIGEGEKNNILPLVQEFAKKNRLI